MEEDKVCFCLTSDDICWKAREHQAVDVGAMAMDTSYLTTQVTTIIGQLHGIFDEIGIPKNEREAKETEVG